MHGGHRATYSRPSVGLFTYRVTGQRTSRGDTEAYSVIASCVDASTATSRVGTPNERGSPPERWLARPVALSLRVQVERSERHGLVADDSARR